MCPIIIVSKFLKQNLIEILLTELTESIYNFKCLLELDGLIRQKLIMTDLKNKINKIDLVDIYRILNLAIREYIIFKTTPD